MRPRYTIAQNQEAENQRKIGEVAQKLPDRETTSNPGRQSEVQIFKTGVRNPSGLGPWTNLVPSQSSYQTQFQLLLIGLWFFRAPLRLHFHCQ